MYGNQLETLLDMSDYIYCSIRESELYQTDHESSDTEDEKTVGSNKLTPICKALVTYKNENSECFYSMLDKEGHMCLVSMMQINSFDVIINNLPAYTQSILKTNVL